MFYGSIIGHLPVLQNCVVDGHGNGGPGRMIWLLAEFSM